MLLLISTWVLHHECMSISEVLRSYIFFKITLIMLPVLTELYPLYATSVAQFLLDFFINHLC